MGGSTRVCMVTSARSCCGEWSGGGAGVGEVRGAEDNGIGRGGGELAGPWTRAKAGAAAAIPAGTPIRKRLRLRLRGAWVGAAPVSRIRVSTAWACGEAAVG